MLNILLKIMKKSDSNQRLLATAPILGQPPRYRSLITLLALLFIAAAEADDDYFNVEVIDPYLDLRTGPGRGYPIIDIIERGERVRVLKRRTDWFKLEVDGDRPGWASIEQFKKTLNLAGEHVELAEGEQSEYTDRHWEMGFMAGDYAGARSVALYLGYSFTPEFSTELTLSQALGNYSSGLMGMLSLLMKPFPEWRLSPFFMLGGGAISTKPGTTLAGEDERLESAAHVGAGMHVYLTRRFMFRLDYKNHLLFTTREENEEIDEWRAGFAFFF